MTMASGRLIYAATTGTLSSVAFTGGVPTGTTTVHDTTSWQSRGLFVLNLPPDSGRTGACTTPVRASPFRYPAPGPPL